MQEVQLYISGERVDLFKDETISLTQTIQNVRDISKVFTDFSKQFNLPASKTNNKLFKHYYNYNITDGFDARFKVDAEIRINSVVFSTGKLRLNSVGMKSNKANSYKVVFFGDTISLSDTLGTDELDTLDLSAYDHTYSSSVVKAGLQTGLTTGGSTSTLRDVVYPFIPHTTQFVYDNTGFHDFGDTNGIAYTDLKPAIKLKHIITAIETKYSLTFSTDFFNDSVFLEMYMWLHREKGAITSGNETQTFIMGDSDWGFDSGTDVLPVTNASLYVFDWTVTPITGTGSYDVTVTDKNTGDTIFSNNNVTGTTIFNFSINNKIDTRDYDLEYKIETAGGILTFSTDLEVDEVLTGNGFYSSPNPTESMVGEITIADQMPKMKIIDFLTNIFKMFNLTAYLEDGTIVVKTLDNFYSGSVDYDITKYIDVTQSDVNRALPYSEINFKYPEPKTFLIDKSNEISNFEFGNLDYDGGVNFDGGNYDVSVGFEHMQYERQSNQDTGVLTQLLWGWFVDSKQDATIGSPLIFFNRNRSCSTTPIKWIDATNLTTYNSPNNVTSDDLQTIHFGSEIDEYTGLLNEESLFDNFYTTYIESVFNESARILSYTAYLPLSVLLNYNLSDRFIISGLSYKINSINTNLQTGKSKLELINDL